MLKFKQGKRLIASLLCAIILLFVVFFGFYLGYCLRQVSQGTPPAAWLTYTISTPEDMLSTSKQIREEIEACANTAESPTIDIRVTRDIDMTDQPFFPFGMNCTFDVSSNTITAISDTSCSLLIFFDGGEHTIKNLTINCNLSQGGSAQIGLISDAKKGSGISSLRLENMNINIASTTKGIVSAACLFGGEIYQGSYENVGVQNVFIDGANITNHASPSQHRASGVMTGVINAYPTNVTIKNCILENIQMSGFDDSQQKLIAQRGGNDSILNLENIVIRNCSNNSLYHDHSNNKWKTVSQDNIYYSKEDAVAGINNLGSYWYLPTTDEFNEGWPILEDFIGFYNYYFDTDGNTDTYEIDVKLPAFFWMQSVGDYDYEYIKISNEFTFSETDNVLYGTNLAPTETDSVKFSKWELVEEDGYDHYYTVGFVPTVFNITLNPIHVRNNGKDYYFKATSGVEEGNNNKNEVCHLGEASLENTIQLTYAAHNNIVGLISSPPEGLSLTAVYWLNRTEGNPDAAIWDDYTLLYLKINGVLANSILNLRLSVEEMCARLGIDSDSLLESGMEIDVYFTLKSYNIEIK